MTTTHTQAFMSILLNNFNQDGTIVDADICIEIAHYINMLSIPTYGQNGYWVELNDFIDEHGESSEYVYMGRDEDGEKVYYCPNAKTNWNERIRVELVKLGYYKRLANQEITLESLV